MAPSESRVICAVLAGSIAVALAGCANSGTVTGSLDAIPAAVQLGPLIRLLDTPSNADRVRAVPARDGSVHVLVASAGARVVTEVVVPPSGDVTRRTVLSGFSASTVDAAFDRHGLLHAIVDREHLVCEQGVWRRSTKTPWNDVDIRPDGARFVPNARDLVWVFAVSGSEIGASGRWEVYGFGGYGAGIIWPWFTRGTRAVVVAESPSGFGPWLVLDPEAPMDTAVIDATADEKGNVYLTYATERAGMLASSGQYYVKLEPEVLVGKNGAAWSRPDGRVSQRQLRAVRGSRLAAGVVVRGGLAERPDTVAYPPHFFGGAVADGLRMSTSISQAPRALVVAEAHDKWFGHDFPMQYVEFSDGRWSAPIEVGLADSGGILGGYIWYAFDITTTDTGRTFVVWPTAQGIVGRWIDKKPSQGPAE